MAHGQGECCVCMETKPLIKTCADHAGVTCKTCLLNPGVRNCPVCRGHLPSKSSISSGLCPSPVSAKRPRAPEPVRQPGQRVVITIFTIEERRQRRRRNTEMHYNLEAAAMVQNQDEIMARRLQDQFDRERPANVQIREDEELARHLYSNERNASNSDSDFDSDF